MSGHTPGPWLVNPFKAWVDSTELCEDGTPVPVCALAWPSRYRDEATTEANARLISAAPCLLSAVELLVERASEHPHHAAARAAIAKARGQ